MKENQPSKETIKIKTLFNHEENNIGFGGMKSLDSCNPRKERIKEENHGKSLSTSFDLSNNAHLQKQKKLRSSRKNSIEVKQFDSKNEVEGEESDVIMKNRQNGMEFKIKIKEYEDCIKLLELREKNVKQKMKESDKSHNERYHQLSQFYNELKCQYESLNGEFSHTNEVKNLKLNAKLYKNNILKKLGKEINEKKKLEDKLKLFIKEKNDLNKIFTQQSLDIETLHESFMAFFNKERKIKNKFCYDF